MTDADLPPRFDAEIEPDHHVLQVCLGDCPLPFFAEYPYFLWGEVNYDSDGDCKQPTDRNWTYLSLTHRDTDEAMEVCQASEEADGRCYRIEGSFLDSVRLAAYLTAVRSAGLIVVPATSRELAPDELAQLLPGLETRMAEADRVRRMFLDPTLAPFDSHAWWGGWKWCGEFSTDFTSGLRLTMKAVQDKTAEPELMRELRAWWNNPPAPFHREGVRYALQVVTGVDPEAVPRRRGFRFWRR